MTKDAKTLGAELRSHMLGRELPESTAEGAFGFMDRFINEHIFGELWQREELDLRTRSLCTIAAVVAARMPDDAVKNHVIGALANGATESEIREVIVQTAFYAGVPVLLSAVPAADAVFDAAAAES